MKNGIFDYINSINNKSGNMMRGSENDALAEHHYIPFMVNRGLSQFMDTVMYANEINLNSHTDKKLQYEFYYHGVPKRKRFSKWAKKQANDKIEVIIEYYKCSERKAEEILSILTEQQIEEIQRRLFKGGED